MQETALSLSLYLKIVTIQDISLSIYLKTVTMQDTSIYLKTVTMQYEVWQ